MLVHGFVLTGPELVVVVPNILHSPGNVGLMRWAAPRCLGCLALMLTAVAAGDADLDLEATAYSSGEMLLCCSRLCGRHGCSDELSCNGRGVIRPLAVFLAPRSDGPNSLRFCGLRWPSGADLELSVEAWRQEHTTGRSGESRTDVWGSSEHSREARRRSHMGEERARRRLVGPRECHHRANP